MKSELSSQSTPDILHLYLEEIGQVPLLTLDEETRLAKQVQRGDEQARERMIKANLRLVVKIACDYKNYGLPLLDLISEGSAGLMKAVERFDPGKGAKLSTYAAWWIKQAMRRAIRNQVRTIRLSACAQDRIAEIKRVEFQLRTALGHVPEDDMVAAEMGLPAWQVHQYRHAGMVTKSLDAPLVGDEMISMGEVLPDVTASAPDEELMRKTDVLLLHELLGTLKGREQLVLRLRYGLEGGVQQTLEEIGQRLNLTRERIRQIEEAALRKLRKLMANRQTVEFAA